METKVTQKTSRQFVAEISQASHAMAGAVIANSAAQAGALGEACMRLSLVHNPDLSNRSEITAHISSLSDLKQTLLDWCDQDAVAIAEFVALREAGETLKGQQLLCQAPAEVSRLSIKAATILQDFRPRVAERVQDDLEMSISLLAGTAQAAMLLLDSNLRIWPDAALLAQYEPVQAELAAQIGQLTPVDQIRS